MIDGQQCAGAVARTSVRGKILQVNTFALRDSLTVEQRTLTPLTFYPLKAEVFFCSPPIIPHRKNGTSYRSVKVHLEARPGCQP